MSRANCEAIAVDPIPNRVGHYLGNELIFALNGTGSHVPAKYRLTVVVSESVQAPLIDTVSGYPTAANVMVNADYKLVPVQGGEPITKGPGDSARGLRPDEPKVRRHSRRARRRDP
jgi:LPS-assembly lipoprotein